MRHELRLLFLAGVFSVMGMRSAWAEPTTRIRDLARPAKSVTEWIAQVEAANAQVTAVKVNPTAAGLEIILETQDNRSLQVDASKFRAEGNSLVADIPNAVLALPTTQPFNVENPTEEIANIRVVQVDANSIRVSVTGKTALPKQDVTLKAAGLAYSLNPEADEPDEEIVVTGEGQQGYRVPNSSVGTRTDTPLRDIPQSIQVVPRQVLQDRQARSITDGLENVSGVTSVSTTDGSRDYFTIRGFEVYSNSLVNGLPDPQISSDGSFVNVERLEVLKGPASVLYGDTGFSGIGGTVNFVTKQPLRDPFYEISTTIGSFNDYQGTIDLSGPLNDSKTALYRFNAGYRSTEIFENGERQSCQARSRSSEPIIF